MKQSKFTNCLKCGLIQELSTHCIFCNIPIHGVMDNEATISQFCHSENKEIWANALNLKNRFIALDQNEQDSQRYDNNKQN